MVRDWSKYQRDIFDTYSNSSSNIAIIAGPGSGKTTVLKQLSKLTPSNKSSIFLAFNKSIVQELESTLPGNIVIKTLHSLGHSSLYKYYGKVNLVESKTFGILKKFESKWKEELREVKNVNHYFFNLSQLYDYYRINLLTEVDERVRELGNKFGLDTSKTTLEHLKILVNSLEKINKGNRKSALEIDFIDMIYLPIQQNLTLTKFDRVFLDESQDLNLCQHKLVEKILHRESRLVSVGDPRQSIYSFLGADSESFEKLSSRKDTVLLPLTISYRCPTSVVEKINTIFNVVESHTDAIKGEVREGEFSEVELGDMVLCRNNKPLLEAYFKLLNREVKSFIRGSEYGKGLVKLIEKYKLLTVESCIEELYIQLEDLESRLRESGVHKPTKHKAYIKFSDNIQLLEVIASKYKRVSEVIPIIEKIFKDDGEGVMLSTIHKAKGLEADRVFLLKPDLIPSKYAEQEWELEQEQKLLFVAYSRPKRELIFVKNL